MLNLLRIKVNGFKLLEDDFKLDLTAKARVYEIDKEKEVEQIDRGLYLVRTNAFVGSNSSGKSTILLLILKVLMLLQTGRWHYVSNEFNKDKISLEIVFYLNNYLYEYKVDILKINDSLYGRNDLFSPIKEISLFKTKYNKNKGLKNLENISKFGTDEKDLLSSSLNDTSSITKLTSNYVLFDDFSDNNISNFTETILRNSFFTSLNSCNEDLVSAIIRLFDDSIEYISVSNDNLVKFKRINEKEKLMPFNELISILSSGTFRGVELYIRCIEALRYGKTIVIDEIENCFQKNLVYNLLFLFNDYSLNKKGAKLIFSTHYIEILDYLDRRDSIFITHKENGRINVKNLYLDYNFRTELLKSKQFDNNVFNTKTNYQELLVVRRALLNELQTNND